MQSKIQLLIIVVIAIISITSCDKIDYPYEETANTPEDTGVDLRKVLIEDFTGHTCGNCPRSHEELTGLENLYGNKVIAMTIHTGFFAQPQNNGNGSFSYDFRTDAGNELNTLFGIEAAGIPNGMVNRKILNGSRILNHPSWAGVVASIVNETADVRIKLSRQYDQASSTFEVEVESEFTKTLTGTYRLVAYLTEDSIINWQRDYQKTPVDVPDYLHRHVLRKAINGTSGETISRGYVPSGTKYTGTYGLKLENAWNPLHCAAIIAIYDSLTSEILQVETIGIGY